MEEKILFKEKTHRLLPFITIAVILFTLIMVAYFFQERYSYAHYYDGHKHDSGCVGIVDEADDLMFTERDYESKSDLYSNFSDYIEGEYIKNKDGYISSEGYSCQAYNECDVLEYGSISAANEVYFEKFEPLYFWIIFGPIIIALFGIVILIKTKKCKYLVTENAIYGKKGFKKFNICYTDIIKASRKGKKSFIVETVSKKLKLSSRKNCTEIFNLIQQYAPVQDSASSDSSTKGRTDDIKLF